MANLLTRSLLESISKDPRWIRTMEQLFELLPSGTTILTSAIEAAQFEAGLASARAQQALDIALKKFGIFFDTTDQVAGATNVPTAVTLNSTQASDGVSVSGSQISMVKSGLYKIEVRVQL